jgi:DNA-binding winged helix-turn-helix (wHTH) protein/TolB-like protein
MKEQNNYFYDFGEFRLDTLKRNLLHNGLDLQIKPRAYETLLFLIERPGEIVSKSELMNAIWADTFVEENNLTQQISTLRKVISEFGKSDQYIVTMPKQGYKFVQPVMKIRCENAPNFSAEMAKRETVYSVSGSENAWESPKRNPLKALVKFLLFTQMREITFGFLLSVMMVWFSVHIETQRDTAGIAKFSKSIAVLEFEPLDGNEKSTLYSAGITRTLTAKIGNLEMMILRPVGASGRFYGQERDVIAIGNELQADIILEGSVQNEGELVRVAVIAWDSKANRQIWGDVFTKDSANAFVMQDEVSKQVISAIQNRLLN